MTIINLSFDFDRAIVVFEISWLIEVLGINGVIVFNLVFDLKRKMIIHCTTSA